MKKIQVVVIGIIQSNDSFLLTKRQDVKKPNSSFNDKWQFPGGELEFGESCEDALKRELFEEVGVGVEIVGLIPHIFTTTRQGVWQGVFISYLCRMKNTADKIILNDEASDYAWLTVEEVKKRDTIHLTRELLEKAVA